MATTSIGERFWAKVDKRGPDDCWEWLACKHPKGYGIFNPKRKSVHAHRVAYELTHGEIPLDAHIMHSCDNRGCVNPAHLSAGTNAENVADKMRKGRHRVVRGTEQGLCKLTEDQVREIRNSTENHRDCAARFGISKTQVGHIRRREHWAHVA